TAQDFPEINIYCLFCLNRCQCSVRKVGQTLVSRLHLPDLAPSLGPFPTKAPTQAAECDRTFVSRPGGPQNGTFTAPSFANPAGHSRQCIYTFLAGQRQRVELVFTSFNLRGTPPDRAYLSSLRYQPHNKSQVATCNEKGQPIHTQGRTIKIHSI
ncbi:hypothetical protein L9F63_006562, partial [Diploptera punctata]